MARDLLAWMKNEKGVTEPRIMRADARLAGEVRTDPGFTVTPTRDDFDYVYPTDALVRLTGKEYHKKRNHLNQFLKSYDWSYEHLDEKHVEECLALAGKWCDERRCEEDLDLLGEWDAIREILAHADTLRVEGGVIIVDGKVEAFTLGELLNRETVVVHIEKATTEVRGVYAAINQQFCERQWQAVPWINREQDLGEEGLRQAKLSYNPDHLVEKFRISLAG